MITNTDCTVIRLSDDAEPVVIYIPAVMWQDVYAREVKKYGAGSADKAAVYIPDVDADVQIGDFIIRGAVTGDLAEACRNAFSVVSLEVNRYGSRDMQHIKAGAK